MSSGVTAKVREDLEGREREEEEFLRCGGTIDIARDRKSKKCTETAREGVSSREKEGRAPVWLRVILQR